MICIVSLKTVPIHQMRITGRRVAWCCFLSCIGPKNYVLIVVKHIPASLSCRGNSCILIFNG